MIFSRRNRDCSNPHRGARRFPYVRVVLGLLMLWLVGVMVYQTYKPLPPGISYASPEYRVKYVDFLYDLTFPSEEGQLEHEQQIFQRMLQVVEDAEQFIVVDMFLFNDYQHKGQRFPPVSRQFAEALITKKAEHPDMPILFITDEINTNYNSAPNHLLESMKQAGIDVVITNEEPLRDSTPIYSAVWRTFFQWVGQAGEGWIPNLMATDGPKVTVRSYLKLLNIKANHRKVVTSEKTAVISSGNIHDASVYHSNIAFEVSGPVIADILATEQAVLDMSDGGQVPVYDPPVQENDGDVRIRYLTEGKVNDVVLEEIGATEKGDVLWMGMFYIASPMVLDALLEASERSVDIRLILDPNENAFGRSKLGIPNRPVAEELHDKSGGNIHVRWYNTTKEQYHTKLVYIDKSNGENIILGGSSNLTPRNLNDYNLENDLWLSAPSEHPSMQKVADYFERIWYNNDAVFTLTLKAFQENTTFLKRMLYKLQLVLGFTTF